MRMALVLLGFHRQLGGYGSHVYEFAKMLKQHDVTILTSTYSPKGEMAEGLHKEGGVKVLRFKSTVKGITPGLYSHLKNNVYDLVHVFGYQTFQPFICGLAKQWPLVFTPFYHPFGEHNLLLRKLFDLTFGHYALSRADLVIAQTPLEKELLGRGVVRPIPVKDPLRVSASLFRKKFKIKGKIVLSVGRLAAEKRFDELIKLFAKSDINATLVIAGGGDARSLKSLAKHLGVKVLLTGFLSDKMLASAYKAASVFALVSKYESFGLVFAEAMSYGTPCVGLNVGAAPYVIGEGGLVVDELIKVPIAIKKLLKKDMKQKALSQAKRFSKKMFFKEMMKLYKGLIK